MPVLLGLSYLPQNDIFYFHALIQWNTTQILRMQANGLKYEKIFKLSFWLSVMPKRLLYLLYRRSSHWCSVSSRRDKGGELVTNQLLGKAHVLLMLKCSCLGVSRSSLTLVHLIHFIWPSWRFNFNHIWSAVQFQWNLIFLVHYNKLCSQN